MDTQENLAKRLLYLPIDIHEKVLLWLAYRGLKPVSEITVERRGNIMSLLRRGIRRVSTYSYNSPKIKRIRKWIRDAGLFRATQPKYETSWHVGKDKDKVIESAKILRMFDYENEVKSGLLLGYPEESAKAYARNRGKSEEEVMKEMIGTGSLVYEDSYLKDKYFTPYIFYNMPRNRVVEDSKVAQKWADTIREEVPILAKWFERWEADRRKKDQKVSIE